MLRQLTWLLGASTLMFAAKVVPVSGVVTLDGKPLASAHIAFLPEDVNSKSAIGSYGVTDTSGAYALKSFDNDQPGAFVGKYRVEIEPKTESDDRDPKLRPPPKTLPAKYNRNTELRFDVNVGGTDKANFDLTSK
jgi:hypothetical protein